MSMPNVFVIPPEEEQLETPPWCCFDAMKEANPAFFEESDSSFDSASSTTYSRVRRNTMETSSKRMSEREAMVVMKALVEEAETLKEKLKNLEISVRPRSSTPKERRSNSATPVSMASTAPIGEFPKTTLPSEPVPRTRRKRALSSLIVRKKKETAPAETDAAPEETVKQSIETDREYEVVQRPESPADPQIAQTPPRKSRLFSRNLRKKGSKTEGEGGADETASQSSLSPTTGDATASLHERMSTAAEAHVVSKSSSETMGSTRNSSERRLSRHFSLHELRRRFSTSSTSSAPPPPVPDLHPKMFVNPVPSVPPAPTPAEGVVLSIEIPTPASTPTPTPSASTSPVAEATKAAPEPDAEAELAKEASAAPSEASYEADGSVASSRSSMSSMEMNFSLDPLHFESLQFNSEDFFDAFA